MIGNTSISEDDRRALVSCNELKNYEFAKVIMQILAKYQILGPEDIALLTSREKCREQFKSDYAMLRLIDTKTNFSSQIKDRTGRNRYYTNVYVLNQGSYVMTSQLYGKSADSTHNNNRTPFINWVLDKFGIEHNEVKKSWLLVWNPDEYPFNEYEQERENIKKGKDFIVSWKCHDTHVSLGDRVYLIRLGTKKRNGIIASGCAVKESYSAPDFKKQNGENEKQSRHIDVRLDCMLDRNGNRYLSQELLMKLFPKQHWSSQNSGISIKPEYVELLEKEWQLVINNKNMIDKKKLDNVKNYISYKGFSYPDGLIENFILSLKSKPFVILAGTSGTGKTRLVKLFANAIGAEYKQLPVRPDWSDSTDLFGHTNLQGEYVPGAITEYIKDATEHLDKPYFLCLDEMNLARVEYYFSEFLSLIETRKWDGGRIITDHINLEDKAKEKYGNLYIPENLYFVGTVNMDETTYPFSKKVLDRANTIEFSDVDLVPTFDMETEEVIPIEADNDFLKAKYITLLTDISEDQRDLVTGVCTELQSFNDILKKAEAHVGYRVRDEIVFYMLNNDEFGLLEYENALDFEIMQKILPRIQGSSTGIRDLLVELFHKCAGDYSSFSQDQIWMQMKDYLAAKASLYPKSAEKICYMMRRFEEDGFTSYWL